MRNGARHAIVLVGNPKVPSRTSAVSLAVAQAIMRFARAEGNVDVIELSGLSDQLFRQADAHVAAAKTAVLGGDLLVVASPVYKASITGLLKAFLDQFGRDELGGLATVPLMVGAKADHSLAVEHQLRPVLVEIGASCPSRGLFVLEQQLDTIGEQLEGWLATWGPAIVAVMDARSMPGNPS